MIIELMTIKDYEDLYNLWISTPGVGMNNYDDSKEGIERYLKRNPTSCFVARDDTELIGAILSGHDGRRAFIYHMVVSSKYRNKGLGTSLVNNAIQALEKEGIAKVCLVCLKNNVLGNSFWKNKNFTKREDLIYRNKTIKN